MIALGLLMMIVPWLKALEYFAARQIGRAIFGTILAATCLSFGLGMIRNGLRHAPSRRAYAGEAPHAHSVEERES